MNRTAYILISINDIEEINSKLNDLKIDLIKLGNSYSIATAVQKIEDVKEILSGEEN